MAEFAYVFRTKRHPAPSPKIAPGYLDEHLASKLHEHNGPFQLGLWKDHKLTKPGPWQNKAQAPDRFADRIRGESRKGDTWRIQNRLHLWWLSTTAVDWSLAERVMAAAKTEIGTPYVFGVANGPEDPGSDAFDCSGYTEWAWATVGIWLPHQAEAQRVAPNVKRFSNETEATDADLVFMWFTNSRGIPSSQASHVGLHRGSGATGQVLDTRSQSEPVAYREAAGVIGYGRPHR